MVSVVDILQITFPEELVHRVIRHKTCHSKLKFKSEYFSHFYFDSSFCVYNFLFHICRLKSSIIIKNPFFDSFFSVKYIIKKQKTKWSFLNFQLSYQLSWKLVCRITTTELSLSIILLYSSLNVSLRSCVRDWMTEKQKKNDQTTDEAQAMLQPQRGEKQHLFCMMYFWNIFTHNSSQDDALFSGN